MEYIQINSICKSNTDLLKHLDRKIYKLQVRNYNNEFYLVDDVFCQSKYSDLLIYRDILENLIHNPTYLCNEINTDVITSKIKQLIK